MTPLIFAARPGLGLWFWEKVCRTGDKPNAVPPALVPVPSCLPESCFWKGRTTSGNSLQVSE